MKREFEVLKDKSNNSRRILSQYYQTQLGRQAKESTLKFVQMERQQHKLKREQQVRDEIKKLSQMRQQFDDNSKDHSHYE